MLDIKVSFVRGAFSLNAEVHDAGSICLCGLNGSGKSTLLNIIAGKVAPDDGYVRVDSKDVVGLPMELRGIVLVNPDSLIPHLEVDRHLRWGASARKALIDERTLTNVKESLGITYSGRVDKLSLGMRERVSLATALLSKPKVILVDEAFSNIDHREDFTRSYFGLCSQYAIDLVHTTQRSADAQQADHHYDIADGTTTRVR